MWAIGIGSFVILTSNNNLNYETGKKAESLGLMTMLISMVFALSSCSDDDTGGGALSYGKVTGVVTDDLSSPLEGVTVQSMVPV